jgi:ribose 1,5-bisphosphokinase
MLILIVGPSGAGKDTLLTAAREALRDDPRFLFARRAITRPPRDGDEDHEVVDPASFEMRRAAGAYALWWDAHGLRYGIASEIGLHLAEGRVVVASVSRGVIADAARRFPVRVIEITAPPELLAQRLAARGRESATQIGERLTRTVPLTDGVETVTIVNDSTVEVGTGRLLAALTRAAESGARS